MALPGRLSDKYGPTTTADLWMRVDDVALKEGDEAAAAADIGDQTSIVHGTDSIFDTNEIPGQTKLCWAYQS